MGSAKQWKFNFKGFFVHFQVLGLDPKGYADHFDIFTQVFVFLNDIINPVDHRGVFLTNGSENIKEFDDHEFRLDLR